MKSPSSSPVVVSSIRRSLGVRVGLSFLAAFVAAITFYVLSPAVSSGDATAGETSRNGEVIKDQAKALKYSQQEPAGAYKTSDEESYPPSDEWLEENEENDDSATVAIRCPSRGRCIAPGTCKRSELDRMQSKKDSLCNQKRSCAGFKIKPPLDPANIRSNEMVDCGEMTRLIEVGEACRDQRTEIMHECFRDGDQAHIDERKEVQAVIDDCIDRLNSAKGMKICKW